MAGADPDRPAVSPRPRPRRGTAVLAVGLSLATAMVVLGRSRATPGDYAGPLHLPATMALTFTPLGAFVLRYLPGNVVGRLMVGAGVLGAGSAVSGSWATWPPAGWLAQWSWWPPLAVLFVALLLFPDGRLPGPRWRPLMAGLVVGAAVSTLALAAASATAPGLLTRAEPAPPGLPFALVLIGVTAMVVTVLLAGPVVVALLLRWRRAGGLERHQLESLAPAVVLVPVGVVLDAVGVPFGSAVAVATMPICMGVAIVQYQLYDVDLYINRSLVWITMAAVVTATFAAATGLVAVVAEGAPPLVRLSLVGMALTAVGTVRERVQRWVDRLLYGRRDDPYAVLIAMSRQSEVAAEPGSVLSHLVRTVVEALRVPYAAALVGDSGATMTTAAEFGRRVGDTVSFPMISHRRPIGELRVAARGPQERFTRAELHLLRDIAGQAAQAAEAARSAVELQQTRERLVQAQEEERRRLRRELHDGLGPALIGLKLQAEALRNRSGAEIHAGADTHAGAGYVADRLSVRRLSHPRAALDALVEDIDSCACEVRRLVDELHPSALDEGLAKALTGMVGVLSTPALHLDLHLGGELAGLPAAVEVAAYRITAEALTNVIKHADATHVSVEVQREAGELRLVVQDNGTSAVDPENGAGAVPLAARLGGLGLLSMRVRAEELAGHLEVTSSRSGVRVEALLPVPS